MTKEERLKKVLSACEHIDDQKVGFVKKAVFMKLLDCIDINLANAETSFLDIIKRYQGTDLIEYRQALPLIMYD